MIAIHSGMEDFLLAYSLNKDCGLGLKRTKKDLKFNDDLTFTMFDWEDDLNQNYWVLFSNSCYREVGITEGLFHNDVSRKMDFLVSEQKEVDFFLRIDTDNPVILSNTVKTINHISAIVTAYSVDPNTLKSKSNLIF